MTKRRFELRRFPEWHEEPTKSRWFADAKRALRAGLRSMPIGVKWEVREHKTESLYVGKLQDEEMRREYIRRFRRHFHRFC